MTTTAVPALRTTWRRSTEHFAEQVKRFLRLSVLAAAPSVIDLIKGGKFDKVTLIAFAVPIGEVVFREMFPALGAAAAASAPGVTIVPAQVGLPSAAPASPYTTTASGTTLTLTPPVTPVQLVPADVMPDPDGADPGVLTPETGHADLILIIAITVGVFFGMLIYHLALR